MKIFMFVLGLATGYVIGTREGREGYEKLKSRASDLWGNPRVRGTVDKAQQQLEDKAPAAADATAKAVDTADSATAAD